MRLGNAGGDRPDAGRGDQLDPDPGCGVDRPQVGDELGEVLDRVDVVVGRRADVGHPDLAAAQGRDQGRRLLRRELAALAGLASLGHLDLELLRPGEVLGRHAEARRGDLLDPRLRELAVLVGLVGSGILAALARVRGGAQPAHADREGAVGLRRERAEAHRRGDESADDLRSGLHVRQRHRAGRPQGEEVADHGRLVPADRRAVGRQLLVDGLVRDGRSQGGAGADAGRVAGRERLGRLDDGRRERVHLAVRPESGEAGIDECRRGCGRLPVGGCVARDGLGAEPLEGGETGRPGRCREAAVADGVGQAHDLEELPAAVRGKRADPHPRQHLAHAVLQRVEQVRLGLLGHELLVAARAGDRARDGDRVPGVDGVRARGEEHRDGMDVEGVTGIRRDVAGIAQAGVDERRVDRADGEQARDGRPTRAGSAVAHHEEVGAALAGARRLVDEPVEGRLQGGRVRAVGSAPPTPIGQVASRVTIRQGSVSPGPRSPRERRASRPAVPSTGFASRTQRAAPSPAPSRSRGRGPTGTRQAHDRALPLGIDRRVRHLGERLPEVARDAPWAAGHHRERRVVAHAPGRLAAAGRHRLHRHPELLGVEAEEDLAPACLVGVRGDLARQRLERGRFEQPRRGAGRRGGDRGALRLSVLQHPTRHRVDDEQLAGAQAPAPDDLAGVDREHPGLRAAHDEAVAADLERGRPQAVAVQHAAHAPAVREDERGRPVPGLHAGEGRCLPRREAGHGLVAEVQGLGQECHDRRVARPAGGDQQLQRLVERGGVGAGRVQERPTRPRQRAEAPAQRAAAESRRTAPHRLPVAPHGVDLAVVGDQPERLGESPRGMRVGGVALVEHGVRDPDRPGAEVAVEAAELATDEEALVDERAPRERRDVEGLEPGGHRRGSFGRPPGEEEGAVEAGRAHPGRTGDEDVANVGRGRGRLGPEHRRLDRHAPPAPDQQPFGRESVVEDSPRGRAGNRIGRQEDRSDGKARGVGRGEAGVGGQERQHPGGERDGQSRAVAGPRVRGDRAPVGERRQGLERERHHARGPAPAPSRLRDEPHAARVVLEPGVVEGRVRDCRHGGDGAGRSVHRGGLHGTLACPASREADRTPRMRRVQ